MDWSATLNRDTLKHSLERFAALEPPAPENAKGTWQAEVVGPGRALNTLLMGPTGFSGWWGKKLDGVNAETPGSINLFGDKGAVERFPMFLHQANSRQDERPILRLTYPATTRWPWRLCTDELRALDDQHLLGVSYVDSMLAVGGPALFLLRRV